MNVTVGDSVFTASSRVRNTPVSASAALTAQARDIIRRGGDVLMLSMGEPDFDTPSVAIEAAYAAALGGQTKYPPQSGTNELKNEIRAKFARENGLDYDLSEIMVANGATQIVCNAFMATLDPGDEVIVPAPYWISYSNIVRYASGTPVFVKCDMANGFKLDIAALEAAITDRTRWLVLNYPNNPTGALCSKEELAELSALLLRYPYILVLSDDIYEHIIYDDAEFQTIAGVEPRLKNRVLTVNGLSKSHAMTGWRVGYCGGPKPLVDAMLNVQGQTSSGICTIAQAAAAASLNNCGELLEDRRLQYQRRRDLVMTALSGVPGLDFIKPRGAFYLFPNMRQHYGKVTRHGASIESDVEFVMALLNEKRVAAVYGAAYGIDGHFRISFAASEKTLLEGCSRIAEFCHELA